jgi:hypothetical protein
MSMTKPHANWCISKKLYINVTNLCNIDYRYTFNKLVQKFKEYTSCIAGNLSKVIPTLKTTCYEE